MAELEELLEITQLHSLMVHMSKLKPRDRKMLTQSHTDSKVKARPRGLEYRFSEATLLSYLLKLLNYQSQQKPATSYLGLPDMASGCYLRVRYYPMIVCKKNMPPSASCFLKNLSHNARALLSSLRKCLYFLQILAFFRGKTSAGY